MRVPFTPERNGEAGESGEAFSGVTDTCGGGARRGATFFIEQDVTRNPFHGGVKEGCTLDLTSLWRRARRRVTSRSRSSRRGAHVAHPVAEMPSFAGGNHKQKWGEEGESRSRVASCHRARVATSDRCAPLAGTHPAPHFTAPGRPPRRGRRARRPRDGVPERPPVATGHGAAERDLEGHLGEVGARLRHDAQREAVPRAVRAGTFSPCMCLPSGADFAAFQGGSR